MSEDVREAIWETIYDAFGRWAQLQMERFFRNMRKGGAVARETYRAEWLEQAFLERRVKHPGLARHVLNRTLKSKVLTKHRVTLLESALMSIPAKDSATVKELVEGSRHRAGGEPEKPLRPAYTRRQFQRLRGTEYPDFFFQLGPPKGDGRLERFSTILAPGPLPRSDTTDEAAAYRRDDLVKVLSDPQFWEMASQRIAIMEAQPEYQEALRAFRRDCGTVLALLRARPTISKEVLTLLHDEFRAHPELVQVLFNHIMSMSAVKWFRGRSEAEKARLLREDFPLRYTKEDALRAYALMREDYGDDIALILLQNAAGFAMHLLGLPEDGMHIHEAIIELRPDDPKALAASWDNIGICWREIEDYEKEVAAMGKALSYYRQTGDTYQELVALRNIGEAQIRMGRTEEGLRMFREIERRIPDLQDPVKRFGVWWNLAGGCRRCQLFDLESEFLMKSLDESPETDPLLAATQRLMELNLRPSSGTRGGPPPENDRPPGPSGPSIS